MKAHLIALTFAGFLIFLILTAPDTAAKLFDSAWHGLAQVGHGVVHFIQRL